MAGVTKSRQQNEKGASASNMSAWMLQSDTPIKAVMLASTSFTPLHQLNEAEDFRCRASMAI